MAYGLSMETCLPMYQHKFWDKSLNLFRLDFCSPVCSSASKRVLRKVQLAYNRAARLVLNCSFRTNTNSMHHKLMVTNREKVCLKHSQILQQWHLLHQTHVFTLSNNSYFTTTPDGGHIKLPWHKCNALKKTLIATSIFVLQPPSHMSI